MANQHLNSRGVAIRDVNGRYIKGSPSDKAIKRKPWMDQLKKMFPNDILSYMLHCKLFGIAIEPTEIEKLMVFIEDENVKERYKMFVRSIQNINEKHPIVKFNKMEDKLQVDLIFKIIEHIHGKPLERTELLAPEPIQVKIKFTDPDEIVIQDDEENEQKDN